MLPVKRVSNTVFYLFQSSFTNKVTLFPNNYHFFLLYPPFSCPQIFLLLHSLSSSSCPQLFLLLHSFLPAHNFSFSSILFFLPKTFPSPTPLSSCQGAHFPTPSSFFLSASLLLQNCLTLLYLSLFFSI